MQNTMPRAWRVPAEPLPSEDEIEFVPPQPLSVAPPPPLAQPSKVQPTGGIQISCSVEDFGNLIAQLNQASQQQQLDPALIDALVRMTTQAPAQPIAIPETLGQGIVKGVLGGASIFMVMVSIGSIWSAWNASPTQQMNAQIDRIEALAKQSMAQNAKLADKATKHKSVCVFSWGCK